MKVNYIISSTQLYSMLFLVRISGLFLNSNIASYSDDIRYGLLHRGLLYIFLFLIAIPMFIFKDKNKFGKIRNSIYLIAFIVCAARLFTLFTTFYRYSDSEGASYGWILVFIGIIAILAGMKGLEGISRSSVILCVPIAFVLIFFICGMYSQVDMKNLSNEFFNSDYIVNDLIASVSDMLSIAALPFLMMHTNKITYKGFALWNTVSVIIESAVLISTGGVLGVLCDEMLFPVYNGAITAQIGVLKSLDLIVMAVVTICSFVGGSMFLFLSGSCVKNIRGLKNHKKATAFCGVISIILAGAFSYFDKLQRIFLSSNIWLWIIITCAVVLPIFVGTKNNKQSKRVMSLVLSVFMILPFLSGCSYANDLDKRLIIKGVSVDMEEDSYKLTLLSLNTDEKEGEGDILPVTCDGESISKAVESTKYKTGKQPYLGQNLFILIGESCDTVAISEIINTFSKLYDSRSSVNVFYCFENAGELLNKKESINPEQISRIAEQNERSDGLSMTIMKLRIAMKDDEIEMIIPTLESDGDTQIEASGAVLFKDNGEKTKLNFEELKLFKH